MKNRVLTLSVALLLAGVAVQQVLAEAYIGGSVGSADIEDENDTAYKIFGGYRGAFFGVEAAYHDLGKPSETQLGLTAAIEATGLELSAAGFYAASSSVDLFGKIGVFMWDADISLTGFPTISDDGSNMILGFGVQYKPTQSFSIRGEYQMTELEINNVDFDTNILSIGVALHF